VRQPRLENAAAGTNKREIIFPLLAHVAGDTILYVNAFFKICVNWDSEAGSCATLGVLGISALRFGISIDDVSLINYSPIKTFVLEIFAGN
jgi:hypothetical protein